MRKNQSPLEDFVDIMARLPWWLNIILAFISYALLHKFAMSFYDPAPQNLDVGKMGEYMVSKLYPSMALFGQFVMPFAFIMAGLVGLIKKFKRTGEYIELLFYICLNLIIFGMIVSKDGGVHKSMVKRTENPKVQQETVQPEKHEKTKIYSWVNERGDTVYSNRPRNQ